MLVGKAPTDDGIHTAAAQLDAWNHYNDNGRWSDAGEPSFVGRAVNAGTNHLNFTVPATAAITPQTFARFRLSSAGNLPFDGPADDGEVEDYAIEIGFAPVEISGRKFEDVNADGRRDFASGMLPVGAYVTLEHEYILIFRKGSKREFTSNHHKQGRRQSAFFWEERNAWFSDVWLDLVGTSQHQQAKNTRQRSGAFPFELPYRLINMFSAKSDMVVDPFLGTGTTMSAAMATARNCIGFEFDPGFQDQILSMGDWVIDAANYRINQRIDNHKAFVDQRIKEKYKFKHVNRYYDFPVMTRQEADLFINPLEEIEKINDHTLEVTYTATPENDFRGDRKGLIPPRTAKGDNQLKLF